MQGFIASFAFDIVLLLGLLFPQPTTIIVVIKKARTTLKYFFRILCFIDYDIVYNKSHTKPFGMVWIC